MSELFLLYFSLSFLKSAYHCQQFDQSNSLITRHLDKLDEHSACTQTRTTVFPDSSDLESSTFLNSVTCYNRHTCLACVYGCDTGMNVSSVVSEQTDITLFTHCLVCSSFTPLLIIYLGWNYISSFKLGELGGVLKGKCLHFLLEKITAL